MLELVNARQIAQAILKDLQPFCKRGMIAGSIRREKPVVKDIEIVVIPRDYDGVFEAIRKHGRFIKPGTSEIIDWPPKVGAKYLRALIDDEIKLDLFLASEANWGGILMLRTGSASDDAGNAYAGFGPGMLSRWKKISGGGHFEGGQFRHPDGTLYPLREEQDVFDLLRVEWVEPRERVSRRAIKPKT